LNSLPNRDPAIMARALMNVPRSKHFTGLSAVDFLDFRASSPPSHSVPKEAPTLIRFQNNKERSERLLKGYFVTKPVSGLPGALPYSADPLPESLAEIKHRPKIIRSRKSQSLLKLTTNYSSFNDRKLSWKK
jgi:hypothetical protein